MKYKRNNTSEKTPIAIERKRNNIPSSSSKPKKNLPRYNGKHPGGRTPKYNSDLFPKQAYEVCSRMGAYHRDLAALFNVREETIWKWMQDHEEFSKKVRQGMDEWMNDVGKKSTRELMQGFEYEEVTTKETTLSQGRGKDKITLPATETITMKKKALPNMGAIAFWLKTKARLPDGTREFVDYKAVEVGNLDDDKPLEIRVTIGDEE